MEQWIRDLFTEDVKRGAIGFFHDEKTPLEILRIFENFVLQYVKDDVSYVLRITHSSHRSYNQVRGEIEFIEHLARGGANVIIPVHSKKGELVETVNAEDGSQFFVISYFKAAGDFIPYSNMTPEIYRLWGKTIGQMHRLTLDFKPSRREFKRIPWHEDDLYIPENNINDKEIVGKYNKFLNYVRELPEEHGSFGLIHSDVNGSNIVWDGQKIKVFDFDDSMYLHFISDLAIVLYYRSQRWHLESESSEIINERAAAILPSLLEGYREEYKLDQKWMAEMKTFLKLREFAIYSVYNKKREGLGENGLLKMLEVENRLKNDIDLLTIDFEKYKL